MRKNAFNMRKMKDCHNRSRRVDEASFRAFWGRDQDWGCVLIEDVTMQPLRDDASKTKPFLAFFFNRTFLFTIMFFHM